ncbi:MAG: ATP-binding protein [Vicinamibacteria bacterium]|nr:ATP-binding protein [Vicinamibacteria bacterium]
MPDTSTSVSLDAALDALPVSLYIVDRDLRVVAWNSQREQGPLGQPRNRVIGRPLSKVLSKKGFEATAQVLRRVFETGEVFEETTEVAVVQARQFRIRRVPIKSGRVVTHVISWFEDITEQRALEMNLIASDRLAFLGQLVAGVAHEVANPLASIAGCAEALASIAKDVADSEARSDAEEFHGLIRSEVMRCERILSTLLRSARPDRSQSADLAVIVDDTLRLLERHPAFTRVRVVKRIPAHLPPARIDPDSLKQVVIALATNAAHAMAGGGRLTLSVSCRGAQLWLDVLDTGPGVPTELRTRIFEPFFTTDNTKGTGLGLAVARGLVRGRGGDLIYRVRRGSGAAFRVIVPSEGGKT